MSGPDAGVLLASACDFGWGSLGKLRLILDELPAVSVGLHGDVGVHDIARDVLGDRHRFVEAGPEEAQVALVINDPHAAREVAGLGVPVIYVDSLPFLWAQDDEVPAPEEVAIYCAQSYPRDRLPVSPPLVGRAVHWVDPIVPSARYRSGGEGVVINVGGLHSRLAGDTVEAYLRLVLWPVIDWVLGSGRPLQAVCGNLPLKTVSELEERVPGKPSIGRHSPYEFEDRLKKADLLITSPGSTTILQAARLGLPTFLVPPQNLSQILNSRLYSAPDVEPVGWPDDVLDLDEVERLRSRGEDVVLTHIYGLISRAAGDETMRRKVAERLRQALDARPEGGMLDPALESLGWSGAKQIAQLVRQAMLAPLPHPTKTLRTR